MGLKYPSLTVVGFVELDVIKTPAWAWYKAIKGLTRTDKTIWLRRILARELMREDERFGGKPKITWSYYRFCPLCKTPLLGLDAERRWEIDRQPGGRNSPCSLECLEKREARKRDGLESETAKPLATRQRKRKGKRK